MSVLLKPQTIKLIDGNFTPAEAKEVMVDMLSSKIKFHTNKNFSKEEMEGEPCKNSIRRMKELAAARLDVAEVMNFAMSEGLKVKIKANIEVEFE